MKTVQFIRQWQSYTPGSTGTLDSPIADLLIGRSIAVEVEQAVLSGPAETADIKPVRQRKPRKPRKPKGIEHG